MKTILIALFFASQVIAQDGGLPVADKLQPRPASNALARVTLLCDNAIGTGLLRLDFAIRDGRAFAGKASPPGSLTAVGNALRVRRLDVTERDGKLTGEIVIHETPQQSFEPITHTGTLTGSIIGNRVTGTLAIRHGETTSPETVTFTGHVRWGEAPDPGNAHYKLTLHEAFGFGRFLDLYLNTTDGKFTHGFATAPNFNNATHTVIVTSLNLTNRALAGNISVTILPDAWIPKEQRSMPCTYEIKAEMQDGQIAGMYRGQSGDTGVQNAMVGSYDEKPAAKPVTGATFQLENALLGADDEHSRVFVEAQLKAGQITGGKLTNHHGENAGSVTGGTLTITADRIAGTLQATVTNADNVKAGKYEFAVEIERVGNSGAGSFVGKLGEDTKRGRLWVTLQTN